MKARRRYLVQKYFCEPLWFVKNILLRVVQPRRNIPLREARRLEIIREQTLLRAMLIEYPYWILGHVRLGISELELLRVSNQPLEARSRAAIRLSADAVRELVKEFGVDGRPGRAQLEAELCEASLNFIDRDLAMANTRYQKLLEPRHLVHLHRRSYWLLLENVSACALILEGQEAANNYLRLLPQFRREELLS